MSLDEEIVAKCKDFCKFVRESKKRTDAIIIPTKRQYGRKIVIGEKDDMFLVAQTITKEDNEEFTSLLRDKKKLKLLLKERYDVDLDFAKSFGTKQDLRAEIKHYIKKEDTHYNQEMITKYYCFANKVEDNTLTIGDELFHSSIEDSLKCLFSNFVIDYLILYFIKKDDKDKHFRNSFYYREASKS